jgi:hypothetical protein
VTGLVLPSRAVAPVKVCRTMARSPTMWMV